MKDTGIKPIMWIGSSKNDLFGMSPKVKSNFGYALYQAQKGEHPDIAKVLSGFGGASVIELIEDDRGDTLGLFIPLSFLLQSSYFMSFKRRAKREYPLLKKRWI